MFNFKQRPYNLLLWTALVIPFVSLFASTETIDIHLHDTYFIIATTHLFWAASIVLLIFWALYLLTHRFLFSKALVWIHILSTIAALVFLWAISFYSNHYYEGLAGMPRRYYDYGSWNTVMMYNNLTKAVIVTILVISLGIVVFTVNLIIGLFKNFAGGLNIR